MDYCKCEGGAACHNHLITRPSHNEDNVLYDSTYGCQLKIYLLTKKNDDHKDQHDDDYDDDDDV